MDEEKLVARLSIIDDISDTLAHIADAGTEMANRLAEAGNTASTSFSGVTGAVDEMSAGISELEKAASNVTSEIDHWTQAASAYDKAALEAVYSTEELVDMGLKSADALLEESNAAEKYDQTMEELYHQMENAAASHDALADAIDRANDVTEKASQCDAVSAEAKLKLGQANQEATEAFEALEKAQAQAQAAMDEFDRAASAEVLSAKDLAEAVNHAAEANKVFAEAQKNADKAAMNLTKATEQASKGLKDFGDEAEEDSKTITGALEQIAETVAFAKIIQYCKLAMDAVYALADAFSDAQKTIVNATGATDEALAGLESSMMSAYSSHHADLSSTAGAIGEINTRMQLTGDALTEVTGQFLDFSTITGSNVVGAVQNVTKIMNKWKLEQTDVVSVLDKLAYAGQISGASVDSLASSLITGAPSFQAMNLSLDTAISLLAAFELQGINSGTAIMALRTAARKFANDNVDASAALKDTIEQIANMKNESEATSLAIKTFGSRAGLEMVTAIQNGAISVEMLNSDLKIAEGTLQKTANAGETLSEKWDASSNKFKTAFTSAVQPTLSSWSSGFASLTGKIGDFLAEHETFTKVLVSAGTTIGLIAAGISGLTLIINTVIPAIKAFGATIAAVAAEHPVLAAITALSAVAVGITSFVASMNDAEDAVEDYNGTLEECSKDIDNTRLAHEKAVEMYGAESAAAKELEGQLDTLNKQYQKGGGAAADYAERAKKHAEAFENLSNGYKEQIEKISSDQTFAQVAAAQLEFLSEKSVKTNADLDLMSKYANYLNDTFECDILVNYDTGELTGFDPNNITQGIAKAYENNKRHAALDQLSSLEFVDDYYKLYNDYINFDVSSKGQTKFGTIVDLTEVRAAETAKRKLDEYKKAVIGYYEDTGLSGEEAVKEADKYLRQLQQSVYAQNDFTDPQGNNRRGITDNPEKYGSGFSSMGADAEEASGKIDAASNKIAESLSTAQKAYNELYAAAKKSFEGQFGLFDEAQKSADATVSKFEEAQRSQLEYWQSYSENISYLSQYSAEELGMSETAFTHFKELIASGSPEAAGLVASMRETIENEGIDAVKSVGETMSQVYDEQEKAVVNTGEWGSGLKDAASLAVKNAVDAANSAAKGFTDAGTVAMDNFALGIRAGIGNAINAAQEVANNIQAVLGSIRVNIPSPTVNSASDATLRLSGQYATGTLDAAPGLALVGEKGPELINFGGGEVVYTAEETKQILSQQNDPSVYIPQNIDQMLDISQKLSAVKADNSFIILPEHKETSRNASVSGTSTSEKRIVIDINGAGKIEVSGDADREVVLEVLQANLKPVLLGIINEEIYEEGDDSYEY